jgi:hypothetical protein
MNNQAEIHVSVSVSNVVSPGDDADRLNVSDSMHFKSVNCKKAVEKSTDFVATVIKEAVAKFNK